MPPFGQVHAPLVQVDPVAQALPHSPQFDSSLRTSWHAPPLHDACPVRQRQLDIAHI